MPSIRRHGALLRCRPLLVLAVWRPWWSRRRRRRRRSCTVARGPCRRGPPARPAARPGDVRAAVALAPRDPAALARYAHEVSTPGTRLSPVSERRPVRRGALPPALRRSPPSGLPGRPRPAYRRAVGQRPGARRDRSRRRRAERLCDLAAALRSPRRRAWAWPTAGRRRSIPGSPASCRASSASARRRPPRPVPTSSRTPPPARPTAPAHGSAAAADASYTTSQIAARYGLSSLYAAGLQGRHVTVAVYELEPFAAADIAAFQRCFHSTGAVTHRPRRRRRRHRRRQRRGRDGHRGCPRPRSPGRRPRLRGPRVGRRCL